MVETIDVQILRCLPRGEKDIIQILKSYSSEKIKERLFAYPNNWWYQDGSPDFWNFSDVGKNYMENNGIKPIRTKDFAFENAITTFTNRQQMAEQFVKIQPLYFDKNLCWWIWNFSINAWEMVDEVDIMNIIDKHIKTALDTTKATIRNEILEALRRVGRMNEPKEFPKTWVQFKNVLIDLETDEEIKPSPEYFCTNPIPHEIGDSSETPTIDRIFAEWVDEKWVITLKEIIAYSMLQDYPIHRMFVLTGNGRNGKGRYIELLKRIIGENNVTSTSFERMVNSRFETSKLHKKLVSIVGETNFKLLDKTDILKKTCGGDMIPGEYKGKKNFDFYNYAKIVMATNNLPISLDTSLGFYSRWLIIDFPNHFSEEKDILKDIPEEEYSNLAKFCVDTLKEIIKRRTFSNEGTIEERRKRYEERSNPIILILNEKFERDVNGYLPFSEFYEELKSYCLDNKLRTMSGIEVGRILKGEGFEIKQKTLSSDYKPKCVWGLKWKEIKKVTDTTNTTNISTTLIGNFPNRKMGGMGYIGYQMSENTQKLRQRHNDLNSSRIDDLTQSIEEPSISSPPMTISDFTPNILWFIGKEPKSIQDIVSYFETLPNSSLFKEKIEDFIFKLKEEGRIFEAKPYHFKAVI